MGYGTFSLITGIICIMCTILIRKGTKNYSEKDDISENDKNKIRLKLFSVRILLSITIIQIVTGIICFLKIVPAVLLCEIVFIAADCVSGLVLLNLFQKTDDNKFDKIQKILTVLFGTLAPLVIIIVAFV